MERSNILYGNDNNLILICQNATEKENYAEVDCDGFKPMNIIWLVLLSGESGIYVYVVQTYLNRKFFPAWFYWAKLIFFLSIMLCFKNEMIYYQQIT